MKMSPGVPRKLTLLFLQKPWFWVRRDFVEHNLHESWDSTGGRSTFTNADEDKRSESVPSACVGEKAGSSPGSLLPLLFLPCQEFGSEKS